MVGVISQKLAERVARCLPSGWRPRHPVSLIDNDEVPLDLPQTRQNCFPLREIERRNDLAVFEPLVDSELLANITALQNDELLVKLLLKFALPLEREVCRTQNENPLNQSAKLQLPDEQARHDRFACTRIVGQKKTNTRQLEEIVVNSFKLMRKRIYTGNRKTEIRIELVGDAEHVCLKPESQQIAVAPVRARRLLNCELLEVGRGQRHIAKTFRLNPD